MTQNALGSSSLKKKDENHDQGTLELNICHYRSIDATSLAVVIFFFCFLSGRLVVTRWRSRFNIALGTNFFATRSPFCEIAFSSLQPLIINYYPALTKLDFKEFKKKAL